MAPSSVSPEPRHTSHSTFNKRQCALAAYPPASTPRHQQLQQWSDLTAALTAENTAPYCTFKSTIMAREHLNSAQAESKCTSMQQHKWQWILPSIG
ncbi:hypothetical protein Nepgr_028930 [Nepenthes gracilis]|uniref:Uncharacterized protein n=1 Tax=Nepenthes gracilis TaxID=150966 RepID=A0AAD3Y2J3_NEPGR|nr:hypothetical protein Nepgr_028930 [Nepenthes gracilis]